MPRTDLVLAVRVCVICVCIYTIQQDAGYCVLMCGDGSNDVAALKKVNTHYISKIYT